MHPSIDFRLHTAARIVRRGGVIAYPTEGVWGLGCDPWNPDAVDRVLSIKRRPMEKGLILIADSLKQLRPWLAPLTPEQEEQLTASWPGANTWLVRHNGRLPDGITGGRERVAVRVPGHDTARALCTALGHPLVSTSANRAGRPALVDALQVRLKLGPDIDIVVPGRTLTPGAPSRIRHLDTGAVVRP